MHFNQNHGVADPGLRREQTMFHNYGLLMSKLPVGISHHLSCSPSTITTSSSFSNIFEN